MRTKCESPHHIFEYLSIFLWLLNYFGSSFFKKNYFPFKRKKFILDHLKEKACLIYFF